MLNWNRLADYLLGKKCDHNVRGGIESVFGEQPCGFCRRIAAERYLKMAVKTKQAERDERVLEIADGIKQAINELHAEGKL